MAEQLPPERQNRPPHQDAESSETGGFALPLGILTTLAGAITWFTAYAGVDDWRQIQIGIIITGFGITWWILGDILRTLTRRR